MWYELRPAVAALKRAADFWPGPGFGIELCLGTVSEMGGQAAVDQGSRRCDVSGFMQIGCDAGVHTICVIAGAKTEALLRSLEYVPVSWEASRLAKL